MSRFWPKKLSGQLRLLNVTAACAPAVALGTMVYVHLDGPHTRTSWWHTETTIGFLVLVACSLLAYLSGRSAARTARELDAAAAISNQRLAQSKHKLRKASNRIRREAEERRRVHEEISHHSEFDSLFCAVSTEFLNCRADEIDGCISRTLATIGDFAGADRSYVFLMHDDDVHMSNTHEWCAPCIEPSIGRLQRVNLDEEFPWVGRLFRRGEMLFADRIRDLPPQAALEKKEFEGQDIRSIANVPMMLRGRLMGFVGFDSVRHETQWTDETVILLSGIGRILAYALTRKRDEEVIHAYEQALDLVINGVHDGVILHELNGDVIHANDSFLALCGVTLDEARKLSIPMDLSSTDNPLCQIPETWHKAVAGEPQTFLWNVRPRGGGAVFQAEISLRMIPFPGRKAVMATVTPLSAPSQSASTVQPRKAA